MSVIFLAFISLFLGALLVFILATCSNSLSTYHSCSEAIKEDRRYNICVCPRGHGGEHICADGKRF